ncbi:MAG: hypothetical protein ACKPJ8_19665, partial [Dolichospermum sp.]
HILPQIPVSLILKVTNQPVGYFSLAYLTNISLLLLSAPLCEKNQKNGREPKSSTAKLTIKKPN